MAAEIRRLDIFGSLLINVQVSMLILAPDDQASLNTTQTGIQVKVEPLSVSVLASLANAITL
jgi:hypothetical protein